MKIRIDNTVYEKAQWCKIIELDGCNLPDDTVDAEKIHETEKALLLNVDGEKVWIPKSALTTLQEKLEKKVKWYIEKCSKKIGDIRKYLTDAHNKIFSDNDLIKLGANK